ncbi:MAG: WecB/TagA/CpsF family glycosyltransferase [Acidobacteriaceae bacterium]|nr:WecB/TagA/CpsF family glycosyltransferase [Acidobacteriaceae bacterium]
MVDLGKKNVLGIMINAIDYEATLDFIFKAAYDSRTLLVSALAVHGVMTGVLDSEHKFRLNHFDVLVPDGQPVRWVLNWLHSTGLSDRVRGPSLTRQVCVRAAAESVPIYLYGSTEEVLSQLRQRLEIEFPRIIIAGAEPSKFRRLTPDEKLQLAHKIHASGAAITLVGLGCPRQETFAYEFQNILSMPILTVGAAFPFLAGLIEEAPEWMGRWGLEWLFRLASEPHRLWKRYLYLNPAYLFLVALQALRISRFPTEGKIPATECLFG